MPNFIKVKVRVSSNLIVDANMKALTVVESPKDPEEGGSFDPLPRPAVFFFVFKARREPPSRYP